MRLVTIALFAATALLSACSGGDNGSANGSPDGGAAANRPTPTIGTCDQLPAPGTWQSILPPGATAFGAVALDPFDVGTVWAVGDANGGAGSGGIWKSTDCGATWAHVNTGSNGPGLDGARLWSIAVDYIDRGTLYVPVYYGPSGLWKSTNGGIDWVLLTPAGGDVAMAVPVGAGASSPAALGSISMDPNDHLHLIAGTHDPCASPHNALCQVETRDGGKTWTIVDVNIPGVTNWLEQAGPYAIDANTTVYATLFNGLWYSDDKGANWHEATPPEVMGATGGEWTHRPLSKSASGKYYLPGYGNKNGLLESTDAKSWSYIPNSPAFGYAVGVAVAGGKIFLCDTNSSSCSSSSEADPSTWTDMPPVTNSAALEYDDTHHVVYSANFSGGLWRLVVN